jgi:serine/threonine protein kinase
MNDARHETDDEVRVKLTEEWDVRGIDVATLVNDRGTVRGMRAPHDKSATGGAGGIDDLPVLRINAKGERDLEIGKTIGEGGMGIVWAGMQSALRREVAIKSVQPGAPRGSSTRALLREARLTGTLEHPNVVPIHALGKDENGSPLIVMKLIEGSSWSGLLAQQRRHGPGGVMSQLENHVRVLIDVAKAANFAHTRDIVHRDLKPDNVMVGPFGEVYVVDWGIAVSTNEDNELDAPLAIDVREVTGSPAYMAPEMACGDGDAIDARTDVYLLGASLHELLTGHPPHEGPSTVAMLTKAYASTPHTYDAAIPADLAGICRTAMHRNPERRYQTAASFAAALQRYLEHRDSTLLTEEATASLETLREAISVVGGDPDTRKLYNMFNECRFGFLYALRIWQSNTRARELLQTAIELMIGFELDHGSSGAASALLGDLPIANPKLVGRVDKKLEREDQNRDELVSLKRKADATGADVPRAYLALVVAGTWALLHTLLWWVDSTSLYAIGPIELAATYALYVVGSLASGAAARETLMAQTRFGAQTQITIVLCHAAHSLCWVVVHQLDIEMHVGFIFSFFTGAVLWAVGAVSVDRRMLSFSVSMAIGLVLMAVYPEIGGIVWMGITGTAGAMLMGWLRIRTTTAESAAPLSQQWSRKLASTLRDGGGER